MKNRNQQGLLVVTIDTEEEGLWSGNYSPNATVKNIAAISRFQALCNRFSIRPTYLITTPVAESREAINVLRPIQDNGRCEIGTHVHPWNSPPLSSKEPGPGESFLCNLAQDIQRAKIEQLTDRIEQGFGRRPISFRAGRYGMGVEGIQILRDLGYRVDSSVLPRADYRHEHGPDFRFATCHPYFPSRYDIIRSGNDDSLLEVPVSSGFTHRHFGFADATRRLAIRSPWRQMRMVGILDRIGIATKVKLSPEQATLKQMKHLARALVNRAIPVLVLMFHSSSLLPGCSPYVKTEQDLNQFLNKLKNFFAFVSDELSVKSISMGDCYLQRDSLIAQRRKVDDPESY